jgi:DNA helicase HerA-like ATPase
MVQDLGKPSDGAESVTRLPEEFLQPISDTTRFEEPEEYKGSIGRTMFDTPGAQDGSVTVLLPAEEIDRVPLQALVRVRSVRDGRSYLGIVVSGPFAEPDGLPATSTIMVTTAVRGGIFMPRFHGRVQLEILGEEVDGQLVPPRFRPLPNSPIFVLDADEKAEVLQPRGEIRLGLVVGDQDIEVGVPVAKKAVLPRHTAVLGTTGGGKSTTIGRFISQAQQQGMAIILLDTEGEYVEMNEPAEEPAMLAALKSRDIPPAGIENTRLYHLVGTETANPKHPNIAEFGLSFTALSPYTIAEIVDMTEPQQERFFRTVDSGKQVLRDLKIFPTMPDQEREILELNEFEEGYPGLTLSRVLDIANVMLAVAQKRGPDDVRLFNAEFNAGPAKAIIFRHATEARPSHPVSWLALLSRLWRLHRLGIFDLRKNPTIDHATLIEPGRVSIIDLSGTDSPTVNNIVISDLLRNVQRLQDARYKAWDQDRTKPAPTKTLIVIEEAHEFLSSSRISKMPILFEQVSRIAKRGRKRWLGLVFVTQLPQHLPREVLGLVNNYVLHKINDEGVLRGLRQVIPGVDDALWRRLPALAPGQAVVSMTHMTRPLLVSIDPSPARLRMIE